MARANSIRLYDSIPSIRGPIVSGIALVLGIRTRMSILMLMAISNIYHIKPIIYNPESTIYNGSLCFCRRLGRLNIDGSS